MVLPKPEGMKPPRGTIAPFPFGFGPVKENVVFEPVALFKATLIALKVLTYVPPPGRMVEPPMTTAVTLGPTPRTTLKEND